MAGMIKKNLNSFFIGLLYLILFLWICATVGWWFLKERPTFFSTTLFVSQLNNPGVGTLYTDPWSYPQKAPASVYAVRFVSEQTQPDEVVSVSVLTLKAPVSLWQLELASRPGDSLVIKNLEISTQQKKLSIDPVSISKWECIGCTTELLENNDGEKVVKISSKSSTIQLISRDFNIYLQELNLKYQNQHPTLRIIFLKVLVGLSLAILLIGSLITLNKFRITVSFTALTFGTTSYVVFNNYEKLIQFFPDPISVEMVGYSQYNNFPILADVILILLPIVVSMATSMTIVRALE